MFISFEGIDGSGKSTQARLLSAWLRAQGRTVVDVREPGGTVLGEQIRGLLLDPESDIEDRAEVLLFVAARAQLTARVIEPALSAGFDVVADRFADSTVAYQGAGRGVAADAELDHLNRFATAGREPDLTVWVDLPADEAATRRARQTPDRMERVGGDFYERVRKGYQRIAERAPERVAVVEGQASEEALHEQIVSLIQARVRAS